MSRANPQGLARVPLQALRFHPRNIRSSLGDLTDLAESIRCSERQITRYRSALAAAS